MDATHKMAPTSDAAHPEMIYMKIPVGLLQCNCQIIGDPKTLEAIVIDPGDEVERILSMLGRYKLSVKAIISTHAHIDHVGGLAKLHMYTGAPVMMHSDDLPLYHGMEEQAAFIGMATPELTEVDQVLKDGDTLPWGGFHASEAGAAATVCGRHAVCGEHRAHGFVGRFDGTDYGVVARKTDAVAG